MKKKDYILSIEQELLPNIQLVIENIYDPIKVINRSNSWKIIGTGNYAAVFFHDSKPDWVVKVYGRNHEDIKKEIAVYQKLGEHDAFSALCSYGDNYIVLKRLFGITLYNAVIEGIPIPESVIKDIDEALKYAKSKGLNPFDVHGKNVVMKNGRGFVVDISDFYKEGICSKWNDLKTAYKIVYQPFLYRSHPQVPIFFLEAVRKGYRKYKRIKAFFKKTENKKM
jgi:hypothetical protein